MLPASIMCRSSAAFVIDAIIIVVLIWRPQGLFARSVARRRRWLRCRPGSRLSRAPCPRSPLEIVFWNLTSRPSGRFRKTSDLDRNGYPRAVASARPILGYAGILSLGEAAFGQPEISGVVAKNGLINEPVIAPPRRSGSAASALSPAFWFCAVGPTRLMVTLGVALMLGEVATVIEYYRWRRRAGGRHDRPDNRHVPVRSCSGQRLCRTA